MFDYSGFALKGAVDGLNTIFTTSQNMADRSCAVYLNGCVLTPGLDTGWHQTGASTIALFEPPQIGDVVAVFYLLPGGAAGSLLPVAGPSLQSQPLLPQVIVTPLPAAGLVAVTLPCPCPGATS